MRGGIFNTIGLLVCILIVLCSIGVHKGNIIIYEDIYTNKFFPLILFILTNTPLSSFWFLSDLLSAYQWVGIGITAIKSHKKDCMGFLCFPLVCSLHFIGKSM